jgi:hypothetical protein
MRCVSRFFVILFVFTALISCKRETSWDVDAAFPIAKSHLNISNFFGDTIFKADQNHLLHIAFTKNIINLTIDSIVKLPDTTVSIGFTSPFNSQLNPGNLIYTNNSSSSTDKEITFDVSNGVELNKAIIKKGILKVEYFNSYSQPLVFNYNINSATYLGSVFKINQTISGGSISNPSTLTKFYQLDQLTLNLKGISNTKVNTLVQTYTISTDPSGQPAELLPGEGLNINLTFIDVVPEYVQGYFGQQNLTFGPDSTLIGIMENIKTSNFSLSEASINFNIINEFGIELSSSINSLKSIKSNPFNSVSLSAGNALQSINVNRASKTNNASNPVFPWVKQIPINSNNSNINDFIENLPDYLGYSVSAKLNPLGNISGANDFAYYGRGLKVDAEVDIPLEISADYFKLTSLSKTDLSSISELENVNSCDIIIQAKNNYAFSAQLQAYLLNEQGQVIDSVFTAENLILPAYTDANNIVLNYRESKLTSSFDKAKIEKLKQCKQIQFVSYFKLPNQPTTIKIEESHYLDLKLSAQVNYRVKTR